MTPDQATTQISVVKGPIRIAGWVVVSILISCLGLGLAGIAYRNQLIQPHIVTVDLLALENAARGRLHNSARIKQFSIELEQELKRMARKKHLVIFASRAVASGAPDITPILRRKLLP